MGSIVIENEPKTFAEESEKTRKAREKLEKKLKAIDEQVTPQALAQMVEEISLKLQRQSPQREVVDTKFSLFDENENPAGVSKKVLKIAEEIKKNYFPSCPSILAGKNILREMLDSTKKR